MKNKTTAILTTILTAALFGLLQSCSLDNKENKKAATEFTSEQIKTIKNMVGEYLLENPEILVQANKKLQEQDE
jgi:hypothetical protein